MVYFTETYNLIEGLVYMGFIEIASGNSVWRGMDYYKEKKVVSWERTGPETYSGSY
ncbi:MAG: zinc finger protein [Lachnospiraceae bacterium]|nr:zinc finger protein [Lachnospiraceae bacterium]